MENVPSVRLDAKSLTDIQLKALEMTLYQAADVINRIMAAGHAYTKVEIPNGGQ